MRLFRKRRIGPGFLRNASFGRYTRRKLGGINSWIDLKKELEVCGEEF